MPLYTWTLAFQPMCIILAVIISMRKKTLEAGIVQQLLQRKEESGNTMVDPADPSVYGLGSTEFKEIIRKEIVEKICKSIDIVFPQRKVQKNKNLNLSGEEEFED